MILLLKVSLFVVGVLPYVMCHTYDSKYQFVSEQNAQQILDGTNKILQTKCGSLVNLNKCLTDGKKGVHELYNYPCDCSKYIQCLSRNRFVVSDCPEGLFFDKPHSTCSYRFDVDTHNCVAKN